MSGPHRAQARPVRPLDRVLAALANRGISVFGSNVISVRGRHSGRPRSTPINPLQLHGRRYLVAPRGQTQWVRNLRASGEATLRVGRRVERIYAAELADDEKPVILREYLRRWKWEVATFFDGVGAESTDAQLRDIAGKYPVFRVDSVP